MTYGGQASDLRAWVKGAQINRDRNLRLQYMAGWDVNTNQANEIYKEILLYRRYPNNLLTGSGLRSKALKIALTKFIKRGK
jgi:spermidine synthase